MFIADGAVAALFTLFTSSLRCSERFILIGCDRGIAFKSDLCGNDEIGLIARRTLDGKGTGFDSTIGSELGLACPSATAQVSDLFCRALSFD